jgi:hypothetical protein
LQEAAAVHICCAAAEGTPSLHQPAQSCPARRLADMTKFKNRADVQQAQQQQQQQQQVAEE